MSFALFDWLPAILITPLFTVISAISPAWGLSRRIVSCEFKDMDLPPFFRCWCSVFIDVLTCTFCYTRLCLIFLMESFCYLWTGTPRFSAYLMSLIARCGFLVLSLLVIFAFLEVRYDTIRRRDKSAVSVNYQPRASFRGWRFGVTPCVLRSVLVPPCHGRWLKGGKHVCSTMHWFLEASCF